MDTVTQLIDTNILVYRYDDRFPDKQRVAMDLLRAGIASSSLRLPYQALVEFVAAATRRNTTGRSILPVDEARREAEEMLAVFTVLYPNDATVRTALRGAAAYQLNWFDANIWAYAEHYGCGELVTEDMQHGRMIGTVTIRNPFRAD